MKKFLFAAGVTFAMTMAVVIGLRMSPDALAVVIGIVCGVLASIPTTVILVWVLRQHDRQMAGQFNQTPSYPPVVVVNGQNPTGYGHLPAPAGLLSNTLPTGGRDFKIIGQEKTETVGDTISPLWEQ